MGGPLPTRGLVDEEDPLTVWQTAHDLHPVVMDFNRLAVLLPVTRHCERHSAQSPRHGCLVHDDVHVRLQPDVARS